MRQVDSTTKDKRSHELLAISRELRDKYEARFYGQEMEVLFEDYDAKSGYAFGHTKNYLLVKKKSDPSLQKTFGNVIYDESSKAD